MPSGYPRVSGPLELVPCESAQVILVEADTRLFLAREIQKFESNRRVPLFSGNLRRAGQPLSNASLAIPAAVAIQNARLYKQAEIFRTELEQRLADLEQDAKLPRPE